MCSDKIMFRSLAFKMVTGKESQSAAFVDGGQKSGRSTSKHHWNSAVLELFVILVIFNYLAFFWDDIFSWGTIDDLYLCVYQSWGAALEGVIVFYQGKRAGSSHCLFICLPME